MAVVVDRAARSLLSGYPALAYRTYRVYWAGTLVNLTGTWMQSMAQGWLVLTLTDSPLMLGLVGTAMAIPNLTLSLFGGVIADRVDRKVMIMVARLAGALITLALAFLIVGDVVEVWHVFAYAACLGAVMAFDMPASQALVPTLVRPAHLASAIALMSAAFNGTRIIGPSAAGIVVAEVGIAGCYFIAAVAMLTMVGTLVTIKTPGIRTSAQGSIWKYLRDGLSYVKNDGLVVAILVVFLINSLFGMAYPFMLPVFARDVLSSGPQGLGMLMAASGAGSLGGTLVVASLSHVKRKGLIALIASVCFGISLIAFANSRDLYVSLTLLAVVGFVNATYATLLQTILQSNIDDEFRGRVMSVFTLAMNAMPISGLLAGIIATYFGVAFAISLCATVVIAAGVLALAFVPRLRRA